VSELETLLAEYGVSIESMESMGKILLAIDLAIDKLGEDYPDEVQDMLKNVMILLGLGVAIAAVIEAPIAAGVAGFVALVGAMFDTFAVGFAGTSTLQHLMEFYTQVIGATDATGIDQAATEFVDVLKSGTEFVAAVISLLTIGQSGWAEMEDALQSLLGLFRSIGDRVGGVLLAPVIGSITSLFQLARNSVTGAAHAVSTVIDVAKQLINQDNIITFLKNGLRLPHLFDVLVHLGGKNDVITALVQTPRLLDEVLNANTDDAKRLIDGLEQSINHFGNIADGARVIEAAIDAKVDLPAVGRLLDLAISSAVGGSSNHPSAAWHNPDAFIYFFTQINKAIQELAAAPKPNVPVPNWDEVVSTLDTFRQHNRGVNRTIVSGTGSQTTVLAYTDISLPTLGTVRVNITEYDFNHFLNRHTIEEFSLSPRNSFTKSSHKSLFPVGHNPSQIIPDALASLQDPRLPQLIETVLLSTDPRYAQIQSPTLPIPVGNFGYELGIDLSTVDASGSPMYRLTSFYPKSGTDVTAVHKNVLQAIAAILEPLP